MKWNKDQKRKIETLKDNHDMGKLNGKRRNSLTGSVMDTSSSSTSSVESDEPELFSCSSKSTKAADDVVERDRSLSITTLGGGSAVLTTFNVLRNGYLELNHKNDEQNKPKSMCVCLNGSRKAQETRQRTKKQTRREKRKREKEKRGPEITECTVKARSEKSSTLIQSLLSLHLVDTNDCSQKTAELDQIAVSSRELSRNGTHSHVMNSKTEVNIVEDTDLFHVYTTGSELRELLHRREKEEALPKFRLSFDDKICNGLVGTLPARSYSTLVNEVADQFPAENTIRMEQRYTQWTKSFHKAMLDGDQGAFLKKFECLIKILRKASGRIRYHFMNEQRFREWIVKGVIAHFSEQHGSYTVIHQLASARNVEQKCTDFTNHNKCRMLKFLLDSLAWRDRRDVLRLQMEESGKTALHLAALTGEPCQIEALMFYEAPPDILDSAMRAPIHYAIMRRDVYVIKMLLWYGADVSLLERNRPLTPLPCISSNNGAVYNFLYTRKEALEKIFMNWVSLFTEGIWSPYKPFTDLHFTKLSREGDCQHNDIFSSKTKKRVIALNVRYNVKQSLEFNKYPLSLLFIFPAFYKSADMFSEATDPQIYCTPLTSDDSKDIVKLIKDLPILEGSTTSSIILKQAFMNPHNGYFYVYQLPRDLPPGDYSLSFQVDISKMKNKARYIMLAVQGVVCGAPVFCIWDAAKPKGKAKID